MNILIPAAAGLGLLLLVSSSNASPKTSTSTTKPLPKPGQKTATDFQGRIADALSKGDADALMAIANDMQAAGLTEEAEALRTVALNLKQLGALGGAGAKPAPSATSPGQPVVAPSAALPNPPVSVVLPPVISPSSVPLPAGTTVTSEQEQRLQVARAMAVDLRNTSRYKENTALVKRFQEQEGLVTDAKYGPKTALSLARLGIVPPRPRYWARKTVQSDKKEYAAAMLSFAATDTARAADWTAASKVQNDPVA